MNDHNLNHRDPETDALIEQLDALGSQNRSTPDTGFEQRIMDSISKQIAPSPLPIANAPIAQPNFMPGWKFNIAAAILLVGSATLLIWSSSKSATLNPPQVPQHTLVSLEEDFDALYDLTDFADSLDSDLDELNYRTEQMHTELSLPSILMDLADSSLEGSL
ncbi:MAG: hypothetical protein JKY43_05925 [Phycisphaerales bacterium]|nr:hypothetical protein [Phycisphaerales bacterium]